MADMVMAAGVDAAGNIDMQPPKAAGAIEILEALGDLLRDRDRARVGEAAVVEAGAGDDVGDKSDIGRGDADLIERAPQCGKIPLRHVGKNQVLFMRHANLAMAVTIGEVGGRVHLRRRSVTGRATHRLE